MSAKTESPPPIVLGKAPADGGLLRLDAMPSAEQYQQVWEALSEVDEHGTDAIHGAALTAAVATYEAPAETYGFDLSSITWESVGRLVRHVDDTRTDLNHMLKKLREIENTIPYLLDICSFGPEEARQVDYPPPYGRFGGEYREPDDA